nr:MAG TPA: hypothetical protein [Caudoviricetes sp.]
MFLLSSKFRIFKYDFFFLSNFFVLKKYEKFFFNR